MKVYRSLMVIVAAVASCWAYCQEVIIGASKMNVVYLDQPNEILLMVDRLPCNSMHVTASDGIIKGGGCRYIYTPSKAGAVELKVADRNAKNKTLATFVLRAKPIPDGVLQIGGGAIMWPGSKDGYVTRSTLLSAAVPLISAPYGYSGVDFTLTQYKLFVITAGGAVRYQKTYTSKSLNFDEAAKSVFALLRHNDVVQITDALCTRSDGKVLRIPDASVRVSH